MTTPTEDILISESQHGEAVKMLQKTGVTIAILGGSVIVTAFVLRFTIGLNLMQVQPLPSTTLLAVLIISLKTEELQSGRSNVRVDLLLWMAWFTTLLIGGLGIVSRSTLLDWLSLAVAVFCMALVTLRLRQCHM